MWMEGIRVMIDHPWSFISGVGWNTWHVQGFNYLPHNQYLSLYFDMGLVGLFSFIAILIMLFRMIGRTARMAPDPAARMWPIGMGFGLLMYAIGITFSNMTVPWIFVWPFFGLSVRYCLDSQRMFAETDEKDAARPARRREPDRRDSYSLPKRKPAGSRAALAGAVRRR
jgi:O-antigen ligase